MRESSDFEETSSDEELGESKERKDFLFSSKRLMLSSNKTDQRFMNIFKIRKAQYNKTDEDLLAN